MAEYAVVLDGPTRVMFPPQFAGFVIGDPLSARSPPVGERHGEVAPGLVEEDEPVWSYR